MGTYLIKYKIATLAELVGGFKYKDFEFTAYDPKEYWNCDAWIASKEIQAKNAGEARFKFVNDLIPLVERFSVLSQCAFRLYPNTYLIYRLTSNSEKIVYIFYVRSTDSVGLHFDKAEIKELQKFEKIPNKNGLLYIMEASNTTTFYARLAMLIMAAEGFAGEKMIGKIKATDKTSLRKILGQKLYDKLYSHGGLRHALIHGRAKNDGSFNGLSVELYSKILSFLKSEYGISFEENVVNPQRNFHDNFEGGGMYEKFNKDPILDLEKIEEALDDRHGQNPKEREIFTYLADAPKDY